MDRWRYTLVTACAGVTIVAGCGSGSNDKAATAPTVTSPNIAVSSSSTQPATIATDAPSAKGANKGSLTASQIQPALLTLSDMPTGFAQEPPDKDHKKSGVCGHPPVTQAVPASAEVEATYSKGTLGPFINHFIASYPDAKTAAKFMETFKVNLDCTTYKDESGMDRTISAVNFPKKGDDTIAIRVKGTGTADIVYVRVGQIVFAVGQAGLAVEPDLTAVMVDKAVAKAAKLA